MLALRDFAYAVQHTSPLGMIRLINMIDLLSRYNERRVCQAPRLFVRRSLCCTTLTEWLLSLVIFLFRELRSAKRCGAIACRLQ
jgi:hypothetical protein